MIPQSDFDLTLKLEGYIPYRLAVLSMRVAKTFARQHAARYGVSIPEWRTIMTLRHLGPSYPADVCRFSTMDKTKVNRATIRLVAAGFISRTPDPNDARRCTLALTESGQQLHDEILPIALSLEHELLSVLDPEEKESFDRILAKLDSRIRAMGSEELSNDSDSPE